MDLYYKVNTNKISHMEYLWFESCFNSGLTYLQKKMKYILVMDMILV